MISSPSKSQNALPTGTVTFLFTDIEGSSKMWQADAQAARLALSIHDSLIINTVEQAGGMVVKSRGEGDSHFAVFADAAAAVEAAVSIQRALYSESWPTVNPVRVRMALHTGDAELRMGDYYGTVVNRAARIRAIAHGGQILLSQTTAELMRDKTPRGARLDDLGRHHLKDLDRPEHIYQVTIPDLQSKFPPLKSRNVLIHNLPAQTTSFIGRDREIEDVSSLLERDDVRLVTLSGPGGTGKTRLSLQVGEQMLGRFADGIFFVPLAEATTPDLVISKTARELDVREGGTQDPFITLKTYLHDKEMLLLLDNFEQVTDAANLVADLLTAAPKLNILITSRTILNLRAEHNYPVPMLSLPDLNAPFSLADLQENEATHLFLERAMAANPNLTITEFNGPFVAEICYRLDGLPLAIELAAARVRLFSLGELLSRLSKRLMFLTGGARDLPQRQQTLRKAIDWSYDLLREPERHLLARLSVFAGGFTLEEADAICAVDGDLDVFSGVELLLDNSLLAQRELPGGTVRFQMLEAIREYALERLAEGSDQELLLGRHSRYFAGKMREIGFAYYTAGAIPALDWTDMEHDNLRAILARSMETAEGRQIAPDLILDLTWFWYRRGFMYEGREWSERVLAGYDWEDRSTAKAKILGACGAMAMWQGDIKTAHAFAEESLAITRWMEEPFSMAFALMNYGVIYVNTGNDKMARTVLQEALPIFRELDARFFESVSLVHMANASLGLGDFAGATDYLDKAMAISQDLHEGWLDAFALNNRGEVARAQGEYQLARGYYLESERLLREMGDVGDLARLVHTLGYIAQHEGDLELAENHFRESLAMFQKVGNQRGIAECLAGLAGLRAEAGNPERAAVLLAAAAAIQDATGAAWWPADRVEIERTAAAIESALDDAAFAAAQESGRNLSPDQAATLALSKS